MLTCNGGKTSPVTMAMYKQFGDSFRHELWMGLNTIAQLQVVKSKVNPSDLRSFLREAQQFCLNGVSEPFFRAFPLSCPGSFLAPELLHYVHKEFWDHDVQWCLNAIGRSEVDFRFSVIQPTSGFHHFKDGISKLKQVTGRVHRNVQRYIIGIITSAAPPQFVTAICALMDFRYWVQAYRIDEDDLRLISSALDTFHVHKQSILDCEACHGKGGRIINNWYIPKLELMQNFVPSIRQLGVAIQWSADITEHAHISEIKTPAHASNNNNYNPQICHFLDQVEKCHTFKLATMIRSKELLDHSAQEQDDDVDSEHEDMGDFDNEVEVSDVTIYPAEGGTPAFFFITLIIL